MRVRERNTRINSRVDCDWIVWIGRHCTILDILTPQVLEQLSLWNSIPPPMFSAPPPRLSIVTWMTRRITIFKSKSFPYRNPVFFQCLDEPCPIERGVSVQRTPGRGYSQDVTTP